MKHSAIVYSLFLSLLLFIQSTTAQNLTPSTTDITQVTEALDSAFVPEYGQSFVAINRDKSPKIESQNVDSNYTPMALPGGGGGDPGPGDDNELGPISEFTFDRLKVNFTTNPHTTDLLGDSIDLNNGNVSFNHTDLIASGNGPDIIISRKFQGHSFSAFRQSFLGNWSLDIPAIQTTLLRSTSRYSGAWGLGKACSGEIAPGPIYNLGRSFSEHEYWNGDSLVLPGGGTSPILENTTGRLANKTTYSRVSKSNWKFSCINVSGVGEGFKGYSPDGLVYTFSKYRLVQGELMGDSATQRFHAFMLVTKIEDRFGNYINYNYSGNQLTSITANDGRTVSFTYGSGSSENLIKTITYNDRVWEYIYSGSELVQVIRPDGKSWEYDITEVKMNVWDGSECSLKEPFHSNFTHIVKHPDGAIGTFEFSGQMHGRSNVIKTKLKPNIDEYVICRDYVNYALVSKTLSGAGLSPMTWQYEYSNNRGTWSSDTPTSNQLLSGARPPSIDRENHNSTTVVAPDGSETVYFYNRDFSSFKEGSLMAIDVYDIDGSTLLSRTEYSYGTEGASFGFTGTMFENNRPSVARVNKTQVKVTQNSDTFFSNYSSFDNYGNSGHIEELNNFNGKKRYTKQTYLNDTTNWLIGLPRQTFISSTSTFPTTPASETTYHSATGSYKSLPNYHYSFGRWFKRNETYHISGSQAGLPQKVRWNATNRWIEYGTYKRGIAQTVRSPQSLSASSQYAYREVDDNGWVTKVTDFEGNCVNFDYDELGRKTLVDPCGSNWNNITVTYTNTADNEGLSGIESGMLKRTVSRGTYKRVTYHDGLLRAKLTKEWDTANTATTRYTRASYDEQNRPIFQSKPHSSSSAQYGINTTYDGLGRTVTIDDNTTGGQISYSYLSNNRVQVNDNEGNVTTTTYLAYGSPAQHSPTNISSPESVTTVMTYNLHGNVTSISQGGLTEYRVYNSYQQLCKSVRADIGNKAYNNNALGEVVWQAHGDSVSGSTSTCDNTVNADEKSTITYDNLGNIRTVTFGDGTPTKTYSYDKNSQLTTLTFGDVSQNYTYNDINLLTHERLQIESIDWTVEHKFDANGNKSHVVYPGGGSLYLSPNALGQATRVGGFATNVSYHANGVVAAFTHQNGCSNTTTLYTSGLVNVQRSLCGSTNAVYNQYTWDANGNLTFLDDKQSNTYDLRLTYDGLDRLDNIKNGGYSLIGDMNYDPMGNITKFDSVSGTIHYQYNSSTKRLESTTGQKAYSFSYDERGNVTDNGFHSFTFNLANQMVSADGNDYIYDGHNRRVKTDDGNGVRYSMYLMDGTLIHERINGSNREYYYLGNQLVAQQGAGAKTYIHPDLLGSSSAKSDTNKNVTRFHYAPFGSAWGNSEQNEIGYTGHKFDTDIGLSYMQARYYDPVIGRFYSNDPVGFTGEVDTFNRYSYVGNNPYKYVDPDGRSKSNPMKPSKGGASIGYWAASAAEAYFDKGTPEHDLAVKMKKIYSDMLKDGGLRTKVKNKSRDGDYTKKQKDDAKKANAEENGGQMSCTDCKKPLRNVQNKPGVPTPDDQAQVHHDTPIKNGGGRDSKPVVVCPQCHNNRHRNEDNGSN